MYDVFKLVVVIGILLWALRDKLDEPRNVKYCCDKANETEDDLSTEDDSPTDHDEAPAAQPYTDDMPAAEPTIDDMPAAQPTTDDMPAAEPTIDDDSEEQEEDMLLVEDLYGDYTDLLMPAAEPTTDDDSEEEEEDMLLVEDLYGDYTNLLMPSIMLRLSNNTSVNNTFVSRTPRNNCFGVVHASI